MGFLENYKLFVIFSLRRFSCVVAAWVQRKTPRNRIERIVEEYSVFCLMFGG